MATDAAGQGHNNPPADAFEAQLEEKNAHLTAKMADLELELRGLPREPATEEEVAKINSWVTRRRTLVREFETRRVDVKAPYLERGTKIDRWFGNIKQILTAKADEVEKRNGPFLLAKQRREEAERKAEAERRRQEAEAARKALEEAQRKEREAREAQQREEERIRNEERQRQEELRRASQPAPPEPKAPEPVVQSREDSEAAHRASTISLGQAARDSEKAAEDLRKAELAANRATSKAEAPALGKVQGGGGSARANMVWVGKVRSYPQVLGSLGPLGQYLNERIIQEAVDRAAKAKERPVIPGVEWLEELEVKTTATRN